MAVKHFLVFLFMGLSWPLRELYIVFSDGTLADVVEDGQEIFSDKDYTNAYFLFEKIVNLVYFALGVFLGMRLSANSVVLAVFDAIAFAEVIFITFGLISILPYLVPRTHPELTKLGLYKLSEYLALTLIKVVGVAYLYLIGSSFGWLYGLGALLLNLFFSWLYLKIDAKFDI